MARIVAVSPPAEQGKVGRNSIDAFDWSASVSTILGMLGRRSDHKNRPEIGDHR